MIVRIMKFRIRKRNWPVKPVPRPLEGEREGEGERGRGKEGEGEGRERGRGEESDKSVSAHVCFLGFPKQTNDDDRGKHSPSRVLRSLVADSLEQFRVVFSARRLFDRYHVRVRSDEERKVRVVEDGRETVGDVG